MIFLSIKKQSTQLASKPAGQQVGASFLTAAEIPMNSTRLGSTSSANTTAIATASRCRFSKMTFALARLTWMETVWSTLEETLVWAILVDRSFVTWKEEQQWLAWQVAESAALLKDIQGFIQAFWRISTGWTRCLETRRLEESQLILALFVKTEKRWI